MKVVKYTDKNFEKTVDSVTNRRFLIDETIEERVRKIIKDVISSGDKALFSYTKKFDNHNLTKSTVAISKAEIKKAYKSVDKSTVAALKKAASRIKAFHQKQISKSWKYKDVNGSTLGQVVTPLENVGLYTPGGKAAYPSSVLMNAIPAKAAGVPSITMCTPAPNNEINPIVLVAADIAEVDRIFRVGGAQAVAAMAYGTDSIPKVDKIVGPGNIYVALAKKLVFGEVDIDMVAGPSEILIIADQKARPDFIAADLLSQAEHDEMAITVLVTTSEQVAKATIDEIKAQKKLLQRTTIIEKSIKDNLTILVVKNLTQAADIANKIAPEHLELAVSAPFSLLPSIKNAGSIFLGQYTPESLGDYLAGPNHVLPTGGTARFFSPLGIYDFQKRSSIISFTKKGCKEVGDTVEKLALLEGLDAHAHAMRIRMKK